MARKATLLDDVLQRAVVRKPGFRSWFERLKPDARAELDAVRRKWQSGATGLGPTTMSEAIMAAAKERGWKTSGLQGVIAWLKEKR